MKFRKFLVGTLAAAVLASNFAFAAPVPKVSDDASKAVKAAVARLGTLGLTKGDDSGNYNETQEVTRAEFAAFLVRTLGLEDAAMTAKGATAFKDVAANHWAAGYVSVASGKGLIKGVGAGKFAPDAKVSYAEAVTMLVRALGYKDSFLPGAWPGNFIAKANEEDILVGVSVSDKLTRGDMAILLDNTLDAETVSQKTFGDDNNYEKSGKSLLDEKLKIVKHEDAVVTSVPSMNDDLSKDEVKVKYEDATKETTLKVASDVKVNDLLGQTVTVYVKEIKGDDTVVYIAADEDQEVKYGVLKEKKSGEITVNLNDGKDTDLDFNTTSAAIFVKGNDTDNNEYSDLAVGDYVKVTLNDGKISYVQAFAFDTKAVVVKEVNAEKKYVKGIRSTTVDSKVDFAAEDGYKIFKDGKELANGLADVKVGDVIYTAIANENGDDYVYGFVARNVVQGKLESAASSKVKVAGKSYDLASEGSKASTTVTYSLDNDKDDVEVYDAEALEDAIGQNVTVYLDIEGNVRHITSDASTTTDSLYGVVTRGGATYVINGDNGAKIFTKADSETVYTFDDDDDTSTQDAVIAYDLTKDSKIDSYENLAERSGSTLVKSTLKTGSEYAGRVKKVVIDDFDGSKIKVKSIDGTTVDADTNYYKVSSSTLMETYFDGTDVDPTVVKWDDIKGKDAEGIEAIVVLDEDKAEPEYIIFVNKDNLADEVASAYVKGDTYYDGDWKVDVKLFDGTDKTYKVDKNYKSSVKEGDFIIFKGTDELDSTSVHRAVYDKAYTTATDILSDGYSVKVGNVATVKSTGITMAGTGESFMSFADKYSVVKLVLDDNEYDEIKSSDIGDIIKSTDSNPSTVRVIVNGDGEVEMVIILD